MKKYYKVLILVLIFLLVSCDKESINDPGEINNVQKEKISGYVQKGPFINGTSITIYELDENLIQTGKSFNAQIADNRGRFELQNVEFSSQYVELHADGFYFNEVIGEKSTARLTLYALSDLTDKSSLNVNIMSHLEKGRIAYLISQGTSFLDAKKKAQKETLEIFSITKMDILESELLDITKDGDDNGILLAISVIIQGHRTDAALSELVANIGTDIKEDGILNSTSIGTELINHARLINLAMVRENLVARYDEMGMRVTVPNFEKYVQLFIDSTGYEFTSLIDYPEFSNYGENILYLDKSNFKTDKRYSLAANLPVGAELKIILKGGMWFYEVMPDGPINWTVSEYDFNNQTQKFTSVNPGKACDLNLSFPQGMPPMDKFDSLGNPIKEPPQTSGGSSVDTITIEYYENLSDQPTRTRNIFIEKIAPDEEGEDSAKDFTRLKQGVGSAANCEEGIKEELVINDSLNLYEEYYLAVNDFSLLADVNFDNNTVIMVRLNCRGSSGYSIQIDEVKELDNLIKVEYTETYPTCAEDGAITTPYDMVIVNKIITDVIFTKSTKEKC